MSFHKHVLKVLKTHLKASEANGSGDSTEVFILLDWQSSDLLLARLYLFRQRALQRKPCLITDRIFDDLRSNNSWLSKCFQLSTLNRNIALSWPAHVWRAWCWSYWSPLHWRGCRSYMKFDQTLYIEEISSKMFSKLASLQIRQN